MSGLARPLSLLLAFASLLFAGGEALAGPWARGAGHVYARLAYSDLRTETLATPDAELNRIPRFTLQKLSHYLEYGLSDRLTASVDVPLVRRSAIADFGDAAGVGDLSLGLALGLAQKGRSAVAVRALVQAPTGDETRGQGLLPTGSGVWEGRFLLSVGAASEQGWAFVELGHEVRGRGLRDGFLYEGQAGYRPREGLTLSARLRGVEPYRSTPGPSFVGSAAGLGDGVRYAELGASATVSLGGGFSVDAGFDRAFRARNLARGTTFSVGLSFTR